MVALRVSNWDDYGVEMLGCSEAAQTAAKSVRTSAVETAELLVCWRAVCSVVKWVCYWVPS